MRGESFSLYAGSESFWSGKLVLHKCVNLCKYSEGMHHILPSIIQTCMQLYKTGLLYRNFPMGVVIL